jgi:hypothetical protein
MLNALKTLLKRWSKPDPNPINSVLEIQQKFEDVITAIDLLGKPGHASPKDQPVDWGTEVDKYLPSGIFQIHSAIDELLIAAKKHRDLQSAKRIKAAVGEPAVRKKFEAIEEEAQRIEKQLLKELEEKSNEST